MKSTTKSFSTGGVLSRNFNGYVTEPAVLLCTVPVLYIGRDNDYIAGFKASGGFALFNIPAAACGADKYLSAALGVEADNIRTCGFLQCFGNGFCVAV